MKLTKRLEVPTFKAAWKGLLGVTRDTLKLVSESRLLMVASALAYTTILSIVPLLAVSFTIFRAFGGLENLFHNIEPIILENLAEGTAEEAAGNFRSFITNVHTGAVGISGFIMLVFTSMSLLSNIEKAINGVWGLTVKKTWFQRIAGYWLFITLGPLGLAFAVGAVTSSGEQIGALIPKGTFSYILVVGIFFALYKWVPQRIVRWRPALIAGIFTATLMALAKMGYSLYTQKVISYSKIYGSLGAVPIVLLWIYISWAVILSGAALSVSLQKRIERMSA
ncbi:MAG: YihY/virulence factor BrkB family protein [Bacteriovoracia bacterium]